MGLRYQRISGSLPKERRSVSPIENEKNMEITNLHQAYQSLVVQISDRYEHGRTSATQAVNTAIVETYWQIGQYIVEFEQNGNIKPLMARVCYPNCLRI